MSAITPLADLLHVFRALRFELDPASRSRFVAVSEITAANLAKFPNFVEIVCDAAAKVLAQGPNGKRLAALYQTFSALTQVEQDKLLELFSQENGTPAGALEDQLVAWDRSRRGT